MSNKLIMESWRKFMNEEVETTGPLTEEQLEEIFGKAAWEKLVDVWAETDAENTEQFTKQGLSQLTTDNNGNPLSPEQIALNVKAALVAAAETRDPEAIEAATDMAKVASEKEPGLNLDSDPVIKKAMAAAAPGPAEVIKRLNSATSLEQYGEAYKELASETGKEDQWEEIMSDLEGGAIPEQVAMRVSRFGAEGSAHRKRFVELAKEFAASGQSAAAAGPSLGINRALIMKVVQNPDANMGPAMAFRNTITKYLKTVGLPGSINRNSDVIRGIVNVVRQSILAFRNKEGEGTAAAPAAAEAPRAVAEGLVDKIFLPIILEEAKREKTRRILLEIAQKVAK